MSCMLASIQLHEARAPMKSKYFHILLGVVCLALAVQAGAAEQSESAGVPIAPFLVYNNFIFGLNLELGVDFGLTSSISVGPILGYTGKPMTYLRSTGGIQERIAGGLHAQIIPASPTTKVSFVVDLQSVYEEIEYEKSVIRMGGKRIQNLLTAIYLGARFNFSDPFFITVGGGVSYSSYYRNGETGGFFVEPGRLAVAYQL